ncbi:hypothetical protein VTH06DRAFT_8788 [Thermothelomyces fergusii]
MGIFETASHLSDQARVSAAAVGWREDPGLYARAPESFKSSRTCVFLLAGIDGDAARHRTRQDHRGRAQPADRSAGRGATPVPQAAPTRNKEGIMFAADVLAATDTPARHGPLARGAGLPGAVAVIWNFVASQQPVVFSLRDLVCRVLIGSYYNIMLRNPDRPGAGDLAWAIPSILFC